jgi:hypothetical protein
MLSDFLYQAPADKMTKSLVEKNVPVYLYVTNTTIEAFKLPLWRKAPHDIEHYLLTGAPFMDIGKCSLIQNDRISAMHVAWILRTVKLQKEG